MANLIQHKRSSVLGAVPAPGDLVLGEIALNVTDKLLYIKDGSNNIVALNDTDNIIEGSTNLFFTNQRARDAISVTDTAGDGAMSYNPATGVFTYAGISDAQIRSKISVDGDLSYNPSTGVITGNIPDNATIRGLFSAAGDLAYNSTTGEFSFTDRTDAGVRALLSATGDVTYNSATGEIGYTKQTPAQLLTAIKTVDGDTSGLDSDLLDGQHGAHYLDYNNFTNTPDLTWSVKTGSYSPAVGEAIVVTGTGTIIFPATPTAGDVIWVSNRAGVALTVAGNGETLDFGTSIADGHTVKATYINGTIGWLDTNV